MNIIKAWQNGGLVNKGDNMKIISPLNTLLTNFSSYGGIKSNLDGSIVACVSYLSNPVISTLHIYEWNGTEYSLLQEISEPAGYGISNINMSADGTAIIYATYIAINGHYVYGVKIIERSLNSFSEVYTTGWVYNNNPEILNPQFEITFFPDKSGFLMQTYDAYNVTTWQVYYYKKKSNWSFDIYTVYKGSSLLTNRAFEASMANPDYMVDFGWRTYDVLNGAPYRFPIIYKKNSNGLWIFCKDLMSDTYGSGAPYTYVSRDSEDFSWMNGQLMMIRTISTNQRILVSYNPPNFVASGQYSIPSSIRFSQYLFLCKSVFNNSRVVYYTFEQNNYVFYVSKIGYPEIIEGKIFATNDVGGNSNTYITGFFVTENKFIVSFRNNANSTTKVLTYLL